MTGLPNSLRAVPALILSGCIAGGILGAHYGVPRLWFAGILMVSIASVVAAWFQSRRRLVTLLPIALFATVAAGTVFVGALRYDVAQRVQPDDIRRWLVQDHDQMLLLVGRVETQPVARGERVRFHLAVREIQLGEYVRSASGRVAITREVAGDEAFRIGHVIAINGMLSRPPSARNPADFDYARFLARQGVHSTLMSSRQHRAVILAEPSDRFTRALSAIRTHIGHTIDQHIRGQESQHIVRALALGDRSGLSPDDRERFARSGLMHLLAVSGLHVMLVGMVFYQVMRPSLVRLRLSWRAVELVRSSATMIILVTYMLVTGNSPSVVRAVLMTGVFILGMTLQRRSHSLNTLGIAALVLLLARPLDILHVGFQLSFSAVAAIVLFGPIMPSRSNTEALHPILRYAGQSIAVSLAATLGTLPILLYHFGRASFAGLILNLAAIPVTAGLLSSALTMIITSPVPVLSAVFGSAADALARVLLIAASAGTTWFDWALVDSYVRSPWWLAAMGAIVLVPSTWTIKHVRWKLLIIITGLVAIGYATSIWSSRSPYLDVLFFDVGQADAALISFPNGRIMLVDAGHRGFGFDAGARVIEPHLRRFSIRRIDNVVISHPHNDHLGGLPHLLEHVPVSRVFDNGDTYDSHVFREIEDILDARTIERRHLAAGDTILIDPHVRVFVLAPTPGVAGSVNDRSVVLQIGYGNVRILLTGDAETASEQRMVRHFSELLPSTLVKAGHHGSSTSSTWEFVQSTVQPGTHSVISVARTNRYRHPNASVVERWRESGAELHKTSKGGALWYRTDGRRLWQVDWRR